jgi:hypothetical protein
MVLSFSVLPWDCDGQTTVNRCLKYKRQVIRESRAFVGVDAPWHCFMGQIEQESRCREGVTAFDGGMGLGQFMPATANEIHSKEKALQELSTKPNPYDARWNIRAVILYDKRLYDSGVCSGWYFAFRSYNGGAGNLNKEIRRAESCNIALVEKQCARKVITLKSGFVLDLCRVNMEYPRLVFEKGEKYK